MKVLFSIIVIANLALLAWINIVEDQVDELFQEMYILRGDYALTRDFVAELARDVAEMK